MVEYNYSTLANELHTKTKPNTIKCITHIWNLIDNYYRLFLILNSIPGTKKNNLWFNIILRKLKTSEPLRHQIEHYIKTIYELHTNTKPIIGHIGYINTKGFPMLSTRVIIPGTQRLFKGLVMVNPAGKILRDKIDHITYFLNDDSLNISDVFYEIKTFTKELENNI